MRLEPTKLILTGTRITYQATGDTGMGCRRCLGPHFQHAVHPSAPGLTTIAIERGVPTKQVKVHVARRSLRVAQANEGTGEDRRGPR